jgi:hypothetical protein
LFRSRPSSCARSAPWGGLGARLGSRRANAAAWAPIQSAWPANGVPPPPYFWLVVVASQRRQNVCECVCVCSVCFALHHSNSSGRARFVLTITTSLGGGWLYTATTGNGGGAGRGGPPVSKGRPMAPRARIWSMRARPASLARARLFT